MGFAYRIVDQQGLYFVTASVRQWVDVFTRPLYTDLLLDSFRFAQRERGLHIYGWVIMSNHFHAILSCREPYQLSNVLRDMKKYTSTQSTNAIRDNIQESRRSWLLWLLRNESGTGVRFWQEGNHPEEIWSQKFFQQKIVYIHNNPVRAGLVRNPEDYRYSSAYDFISTDPPLLELSAYDGHFRL